jgi:hypothetical protein
VSIRDDFKTYLLTKTGITDLVGVSGSDRVFPGFLPQGKALPAIVLLTVSDVPDHDMDGANGWTVARIQVDCYAATPGGADALAEQVRLACDGKSGTMGSSTVNWCFHDDAGDDPYPEPENEPRRRARVRADYRVAYVKTIPTL